MSHSGGNALVYAQSYSQPKRTISSTNVNSSSYSKSSLSPSQKPSIFNFLSVFNLRNTSGLTISKNTHPLPYLSYLKKIRNVHSVLPNLSNIYRPTFMYYNGRLDRSVLRDVNWLKNKALIDRKTKFYSYPKFDSRKTRSPTQTQPPPITQQSPVTGNIGIQDLPKYDKRIYNVKQFMILHGVIKNREQDFVDCFNKIFTTRHLAGENLVPIVAKYGPDVNKVLKEYERRFPK